MTTVCPTCGKCFQHLLKHTSQSTRCRISGLPSLSISPESTSIFPFQTNNGGNGKTHDGNGGQKLPPRIAHEQEDTSAVSFPNSHQVFDDSDFIYLDSLEVSDDVSSTTSDVTENRHIETLLDQLVQQDPHVLPGGVDPPLPAINIPITCPPPVCGISLFSPSEMSYLRILSYCDDHGCPRYFFDGLMKLLWDEAIKNQFHLKQKAPRRETLLRRVSKVCEAPPPIAETVALENCTNQNGSNHLEYRRLPRDVAVMFRYDFLLQMMDLLSDAAIFGNLDNLDVNNNGSNPDCFGKFFRPDGGVYEVNSGSWYQHAYDNLITDPQNELLVPLIFYVDKTGTDSLQRHGVEPFMFTTSLINLKQRQSTRSWRVLCYVPELKGKSSAQSKVDNARLFGKHQRDYHKVLEKSLESLVMVQNNVVRAWVRLGDQLKLVRLFFPVAMIVNDGKSADMLCNRYGAYQRCGRISRACDASPNTCSSNYYACTYLMQANVDREQALALGLAAEEEPPQEITRQYHNVGSASESRMRQDMATKNLHAIAAHAVRNAFRNVCFGGDPRGIYGATPTDLMHAFNEGILKYCMKNIFEKIPPSRKARLDDVVDNVFRKQRSSLRRVFPRTNFVKGFSNLTLITASEWVGVCFTTFILTMLEQGQAILLPILNGVGEGEEYVDAPDSEDCSTDDDSDEDELANESGKATKSPKRLPCTLLELQQLLQALLCFHAWAKCTKTFDCSPRGVANMKHAIKVMLDQIKLYLPRVTGMGWNIQKFHDITHLPDDIVRFGSPQNTDAGSGERSLKYFAKLVASTSQKREGKFDAQVASRLHERSTISRAKRITDPLNEWESPKSQDVDDAEPVDDDQESAIIQTDFSSKKSRYAILFDELGTFHGTKWNGKDKASGHMEVHPLVVQWFKSNGKFTSPVHCWTEYKRDGNQFRAHPNFRSDGPWYDWVNILFDMEGNDDDSSSVSAAGSFFPAKILCFYNNPDNGNICALVHTCSEKEDADYAPICDEWFLEYAEQLVCTVTEEELANGQLHARRRKERLLFPVLRSVSVEAFGEPLFVVQEVPGVHESFVKAKTTKYYNRCIVVKNREEFWANEFC